MSFFLLFLFADPCLAAREDGVSLLSRVGSGILGVSIEASHHMSKEVEEEHLFFSTSENEDEDRSKQEPVVNGKRKKKHRENLPLSWELGFDYTLLAVPGTASNFEVDDNVVGAQAGLNWQVTHNIGSRLGLSAALVPEEKYSHSSVDLRFDYTFRLGTRRSSFQLAAERGRADSESSNASDYYKREREEILEKVEREYQQALWENNSEAGPRRGRVKDDHYPNIKAGYRFAFGNHQVGARPFTRVLQGAALEGQSVFEYSNGPELSYSPNSSWTIKATAKFYSYNSSVDSFVSKLEIGNVLQNVGWVGDPNQFMLFPSSDFSGSVEWCIDDKSEISSYFHYTSYALLGQQDTMTVSPAYSRDLGIRWAMKVGADLLFGTVGGPWFMSALGVFQLSYKL